MNTFRPLAVPGQLGRIAITFLLGTTSCMGWSDPAQAADPARCRTNAYALLDAAQRARGPERSAAKPAEQVRDDTRWVDARALDVEGKGWVDTKSFYDRLPARAEGVVRPAVWDLSRQSAGLCVRFVTDAPKIQARWTVTSGNLAMQHMPATGVSGLDLYVRAGDGRWRWVGVGQPRQSPTNTETVVAGLPVERREFMLYLPLYNGVSSLEIGVPEGRTIEKPANRPDASQKPIVFYGTSITQGGCASRCGAVHTAILGRRLNRPVINLGFSGNGLMEPEVASLLAELDPAVYVLDSLPNMSSDTIPQRVDHFVKTLRKAHPATPIVLAEDRTYSQADLVPGNRRTNQRNRAALKAAYDHLLAEGFKRLYYLPGDPQLGNDGEGTVDGSHPNDLGFARMADAFAPILEQALRGSAGNSSVLSRDQASAFARLALKGLSKEYPNKPDHVLSGPADIKSPRALHPAFFGSYDWHSSVHGHWMLVRLLRRFPDLPEAGEIRSVLNEHLAATSLKAEAAYFARKESRPFERPYGWAWLLKLSEELHGWSDADAQRWSENLRPLTELIVARYVEFFPKQTYPIRTGVHPNTAFGLSFAHDYAVAVGNLRLRALVKERARAYYAADADAPAGWEPGGADFFSPSLMEADLMRRILPRDEFRAWFGRFLPGASRGVPKSLWDPAVVTDRTDPQLVHLDGLNLSRAWCMRNIVSALPADDPSRRVLSESATRHSESALGHVASGDYAGEHWLASFAVYLLTSSPAEEP
jgi:lysophospholipase L1-like esterase